MTMSALGTRTFVDCLGASALVGKLRLDEVDAAITAAYADARAAWPDVHLELPAFGAALATCIPDHDDASRSIASLHTRDVFLAWACAHGDPAALRVFERDLLPAGVLAGSRIDASDAFKSELRDELRVHLLAPLDAEPPRITHYLGRGPLQSWVQVAAIRLGYSLKRRDARHDKRFGSTPPSAGSEGTDDALADLLWLDDPEKLVMRSEFRAAFKDAFSRALAELEPRTRNVLRLHLVDGLSTEAIGRMYGAHRATVARWIATAHETLGHRTRAQLKDTLHLRPDELDSIIRWMGSQLEISLAAILR